MKIVAVYVVLSLSYSHVLSLAPYKHTNTFRQTAYQSLKCTEPSEQSLLAQLAEVYRFEPNDHNADLPDRDAYSTDCPIDPNGPVLCPYLLEEIEDPDRLPSRVSVARCACKDCKSNQDAIGGRCSPITRITTVLRKTGECESGVFTYKPVDEILPVAFVYTKPLAY